MPSIEAPSWWADLQEDREQLTGRRAPESWLDEELEFVPRRRRFERDDAELHGRFLHAESASHGEEPGLAPRAGRDIRLEGDVPTGSSASPASAADPGASADARVLELRRASVEEHRELDAPAARRTVQITGRPEGAFHAGRRRPSRSAGERVAGHRPDRIALWAVVLGIVLIVLAATSASSHAAVPAVQHAAALLGAGA